VALWEWLAVFTSKRHYFYQNLTWLGKRNDMKKNKQTSLTVLSVLHYVFALQLIATCLFMTPFILVGISNFIHHLHEPVLYKHGPYSFKSWGEVIFILAIYFIIWIITISVLVAAGKLRKHKARRFCLAVAIVECINFPLGTSLGIATLVVLTKTSIKRIFDNDSSDPEGITSQAS